MKKDSATSKAISHIKTQWRKGESLKETADKYSVNAGNLAREFKKQEGLTVKEYVDSLRECEVMKRLSVDNCYGFEIASDLGFKSAPSFYRWVAYVFDKGFRELRREVDDKK